METAKWLLNDSVVFPAFQLALVLLAAYSFAKDSGIFSARRAATLTVRRGEKSWESFGLAYGLITMLFLQVINTTDALKGYKTIVTILDILLLFYLCFFNGWFRDRVLRVVNESKDMEER